MSFHLYSKESWLNKSSDPNTKICQLSRTKRIIFKKQYLGQGDSNLNKKK